MQHLYFLMCFRKQFPPNQTTSTMLLESVERPKPLVNIWIFSDRRLIDRWIFTCDFCWGAMPLWMYYVTVEQHQCRYVLFWSMLWKWYSSYTGVTHLVFVMHLSQWQCLTAVKHLKLLHSLEIVPMSKSVLPLLF